MLSVCREAVKDVHKETGLTAFHLAVSKGRDPEIVRCIVKGWPGAAAKPTALSGGSIPLHSVKDLETAKILIEACPSAVHATNNAGYLPIHRVAYASNVPAVVLQYLIDEGLKRSVGGWEGAGGVLVETENGITPLRAAIDMIDKSSHVNEFLKGDGTLLSPVAARKWEKLAIIVKAATDRCQKELARKQLARKQFPLQPNKQTPLLHSMAALQCPESIVLYALKLKPGQCRERDRFGCTALSLAASSPGATDGMMRILLEPPYGYKKQARMLDFTASLPLHRYISCGPGRYDNGMKVIINAEPKALEARDGISGMYPFMLAAETDNSDLDTVYSLLRETPWLVSRCVDIGRS